MSMTSPIVAGGASAGHAAAGGASTSPTASASRREAPSPATIEVAAVVSGVATQYWDEAVPYPSGSPNRLWLFVDGAWRALSSPTTAIRDLVQRAFLGTGSDVRVWYDGSTVVGLVISGS